MTESEKFAEALFDMIIDADQAKQQELRAVYNMLLKSQGQPLARHIMRACKEAFELIDEESTN